MEFHDCLHSPMAIFADMIPKNESIESFARRVRQVFFKISRVDWSSQTIKLIITDIEINISTRSGRR